jgi:hypothetical protein
MDQKRIPTDPNNLSWATDDTGYGAQILSKMGWKRGTGLGKNNTGTATMSISQRVRLDNVGIGAEEVKSGRDEQWTSTTRNYEEALQKLVIMNSETTGKKEKIKNRKSKSKETKEKKEKKEKKRKEKVTETSLKRTHRSKFIKSKRVSSYGEDALRQILGVGSSPMLDFQH